MLATETIDTRRRRNLFTALLASALSALCIAVIAPSAQANTESVSTTWGYGSLTANLSGATVSATGRATDRAADGNCVYTEARIVRAWGTNPEKVLATACGNGVTRTGSWNFTSYAGFPQYMQLKVCKAINYWPDSCTAWKTVSFN